MGGPAIKLTNFSHVCVGVSEMERSLDFYCGQLGMEKVFDVTLDGEALETVTADAGASGRMIGLLVPGSGVVVELLCFGHRNDEVQSGSMLGYTNISFNVDDLDAAHASTDAAGLNPGPVADFEGVRMFFLIDPDGTPIEIVEYPGSASTNLEYQAIKE